MESADNEYTFITLMKTLGAIYSSVNHAVLAQQELGRGLKQDVHELIVSFLERILSAKLMVLQWVGQHIIAQT